jgi:hypothetical protein
MIANNTTFDQSSVVFTNGGANGGFDTRSFNITLPPLMPASVTMRCSVPNVNGVPAGIVSYRIQQ